MLKPTPARAAGDLWRALGLDEAALARLTLEGAEPALPSSFAVGTAAQVSLAAVAEALSGWSAIAFEAAAADAGLVVAALRSFETWDALPQHAAVAALPPRGPLLGDPGRLPAALGPAGDRPALLDVRRRSAGATVHAGARARIAAPSRHRESPT